MAKLSATKKWMLAHPDDEPSPRNHSAAQVWRRKRGIEVLPHVRAQSERYEAAMAAKRAALAPPETKPAALPAPRMTRAPRTLALFECTACAHTGPGRIHSPVPLACSGCGRVGTAHELPAPWRK